MEVHSSDSSASSSEPHSDHGSADAGAQEDEGMSNDSSETESDTVNQMKLRYGRVNGFIPGNSRAGQESVLELTTFDGTGEDSGYLGSPMKVLGFRVDEAVRQADGRHFKPSDRVAILLRETSEYVQTDVENIALANDSNYSSNDEGPESEGAAQDSSSS